MCPQSSSLEGLCPPRCKGTSPCWDWVRAVAAPSLQGKLRNPEIWGDLKGTLPCVSAGGRRRLLQWGPLGVSRIPAKELLSPGQQMGWKISNERPQLRGVPEVKGPFPNLVQTLFLFVTFRSLCVQTKGSEFYLNSFRAPRFAQGFWFSH